MKNKRKFGWMIFFLMICLVLPVFLGLSAVFIPPQFDETYLGEMKDKKERLEETQGKKIIVVGGSSVAFGIRSDMMEEELGMPVINWGLYAPLGSRTMLEACFDEIGRGDIVIFSPEQNEETLSFDFQAETVWQAMDGDFGMFGMFDESGLRRLLGKFPGFAVSRLKYYMEGKPEGSGIYRRESFNKYGDIASSQRESNIMTGEYDPTQMIDFSFFPETSFLEYLNEYADRVRRKGAEFYYRFCPMNQKAVLDETEIDSWYLRLEEEADFTILGDPHQCVMESGWFYDTNFHLNEAGAVVNTYYFVRDVKAWMGDSSPTQIELPEMPAPKMQRNEGDNSDAAYFIYGEEGESLVIAGVTAEGAAREELILPVEYEGKKVAGLKADSLRDCTSLKQVTVQEGMVLYDGCFSGCPELEKIILAGRPSRITAGEDLLRGTDALLYTEYADEYRLDYSWARYSDKIKSYNG